MSPMPTPAAGDLERLFAAIPERNTGDCLLRTMQQHHVQLSTMADNKANIIITMSSIVLTLVLGRLDDPQLRIASLTLAAKATADEAEFIEALDRYFGGQPDQRTLDLLR